MKEQTGKRTKAEEAGMVLSAEIINEFIEHLKAKGYVRGTIDRYEKDLKLLYESLPKDKRIYRDTLAQCRKKLSGESAGNHPNRVSSLTARGTLTGKRACIFFDQAVCLYRDCIAGTSKSDSGSCEIR